MRTEFVMLARIRQLAICVLAVIPAAGWSQRIGEPIPAWSPGTLDIHQINTGRGNSALLIFPDGTSLLVDAGDTTLAAVSPRPDASRGAGEWIARYAKHMLAHDEAPALDYALMTHFHWDHMGGPAPDALISEGGYALSGLTEVAEYIPIRTIIERGWPDYDHPTPVEGELIDNYRKFLDWQTRTSGLAVERILPGRADQIVLRRAPDSYPNFSVRNIAANGEIWTGVGTNTRQYFPRVEDLEEEDYPTENMSSVAIRVSYGKFDYYTGGDMPGIPSAGVPIAGMPYWHDIEIPVARVVGPVEVAVLNHHGLMDATSQEFLQALRPRVMVIPVWAHLQPSWSVLSRVFSPRVFSGQRDVFATDLSDEARVVLGEARTSQFKSTRGHTVVRVQPGGELFHVLVLDDTDEKFTVREIFGPYEAR